MPFACPIRDNSFPAKYLPLPARRGQLALFRTFAPSGGATWGPARRRLWASGVGQIGFVSHDGFRQRRRAWPVHVRAEIGFVSHDRSHQRHGQPCRTLAIGVRAGIGFVLPRPFWCPIRHNSFPIRYLPFTPPGTNWLCFAQSVRAGAPPRSCRPPRITIAAAPIGFVSHDWCWWGGSLPGLAGSHAFLPLRGVSPGRQVPDPSTRPGKLPTRRQGGG